MNTDKDSAIANWILKSKIKNRQLNWVCFSFVTLGRSLNV
jgi:hypothetical protein